jgi:hypothetical protein
MSTNDFDGLLRDKFDEGEFAYKPQQWEKLSHQLNVVPPVRKKGITWYKVAGVAASVALLASIFIGYYNSRQHEKPAATNIATATQPTPIQHTTVAVTPTTNQAPPSIKEPAHQNILAAPNSAKNVIANGKSTTVTQEIIAGNQNTPAPVPQPLPEASVQQDTTTVAAAPKRKTVSPQYQAQALADFSDDLIGTSRVFAQNSFSLVGGVNYGSFNAGYTAGVNGRKKLGNKLYLEGDVAFVSANPTQVSAVSRQQYDNLTNYFSPGTAAMAAAKPNTTTPNNVYYLQVAPSVGYALSKKFSVSVGGDIQRLLQSDESATVRIVNDETVKEIPSTDIGMQGKAEYAVTKKLKAGVTYREGINSMLDPKYLDRRYLQVQLKLVLFGGKH